MIRIGFHTESYGCMYMCKTVWKSLEHSFYRNGEWLSRKTGNKNHCRVAGYFSLVLKQPKDVTVRLWFSLLCSFCSPWSLESLIHLYRNKSQGGRPVDACGPGKWYKPLGPRGPGWAQELLVKLWPAVALQECDCSIARSSQFQEKLSIRSACEISQFLHVGN